MGRAALPEENKEFLKFYKPSRSTRYTKIASNSYVARKMRKYPNATLGFVYLSCSLPILALKGIGIASGVTPAGLATVSAGAAIVGAGGLSLAAANYFSYHYKTYPYNYPKNYKDMTEEDQKAFDKKRDAKYAYNRKMIGLWAISAPFAVAGSLYCATLPIEEAAVALKIGLGATTLLTSLCFLSASAPSRAKQLDKPTTLLPSPIQRFLKGDGKAKTDTSHPSLNGTNLGAHDANPNADKKTKKGFFERTLGSTYTQNRLYVPFGIAGTSISAFTGFNAAAYGLNTELLALGLTSGATVLGLSGALYVISAPKRAKENVLKKIGEIQAVLEKQGHSIEDIKEHVKLENGKFEANDTNNTYYKKIAEKLNEIYNRIYIYKDNPEFKGIVQCIESKNDGMDSAIEMLKSEKLKDEDKEAIAEKKSNYKNRLDKPRTLLGWAKQTEHSFKNGSQRSIAPV